MTLTLEIEGQPVLQVNPENNKEVYAITGAWMNLLDFFGITDYIIYKTFKSIINHADNQQYTDRDNSICHEETEQLQRMDPIHPFLQLSDP